MPVGRLLDLQDHLAEVASGAEDLVGASGLGQREPLVDRDLQLPGGQQRPDQVAGRLEDLFAAILGSIPGQPIDLRFSASL